jgi:hypothetical protein
MIENLKQNKFIHTFLSVYPEVFTTVKCRLQNFVNLWNFRFPPFFLVRTSSFCMSNESILYTKIAIQVFFLSRTLYVETLQRACA